MDGIMSPTVQSILEEERRLHKADVELYKARNSFLEGKLASIGLNDVSNPSNYLVVPTFHARKADWRSKELMTLSQLLKYEVFVAALSLDDLVVVQDIALDQENIAEQY
jgi:hypothetical protein